MSAPNPDNAYVFINDEADHWLICRYSEMGKVFSHPELALASVPKRKTPEDLDGKQGFEMARRIMVCLNACEGVPTEALQTFGNHGLFAKLWRDEWEQAFNKGSP